MARIVQLAPALTPRKSKLYRLHTVNRYCIGLTSDTDVEAAQQLAQQHGGMCHLGTDFHVRQTKRTRASLQLLGIVVLAKPVAQTEDEEADEVSPMDVLRAMCNVIDARSHMILAANIKNRDQGKLKPWMTERRSLISGNIVARTF